MKNNNIRKQNYWVENNNFSIDLSLSENPLGCSTLVEEKLKFNSLDIAEYPNQRKIIKTISSKFSIPEINLAIGAGADEFINLIPQLFLKNGDVVLMPETTFPRFEQAVKLFGGTPVFIPMKKDMRVDFELLKEKLNSEVKMIFLANPNNPTGLVEEKAKIIDLARQTEAFIVVDEAGIEFSDSNFSLIKDVATMDNLLVLRSFSKSYGMAGLRVGLCIAKEKIIDAINQIKLPFSVSSISLAAVEIALNDKGHIERTNSFIKKETGFLSEELRGLGFSVMNTNSNHFLVGINDLFLSSTEFVRLLNKNGAHVVDGSCFRGLGNKFIRISPRGHETNIKFIEIVKKLI